MTTQLGTSVRSISWSTSKTTSSSISTGHEIKETDTGNEVSIEEAIRGFREGKKYTMRNKWPNPNNHIGCWDWYWRVDGVDFRLMSDQAGCNNWGVLRSHPRHYTPRHIAMFTRWLTHRGNRSRAQNTDEGQEENDS